VDGTRSALIVASDEYADPGLRRLRAPGSDARALAAVLRDPGIGGFEVRTLLNEPAHVVNLAVEEFFADRRPGDLLLVHFSCHGVKDEDGELYFATSNTVLGRLGATAVAAEFVSRRMSRGRSRRVVLLLDCCYAGAFERSLMPRASVEIGIGQQFGGRGRAVITASSAMEYAFEAGELADTREVPPSVFTSALVHGLATGEADQDQDGLVGLDELYDYVYDRVRAATPNQTPGKWTFGMEGELYIARRARPVTTPAPLSSELRQAIDSPLAGVRAGAVQELAGVLRGRHAGMALGARLALGQLTSDDSRAVAAAAIAALSDHPSAPPQPAPPQLVLSASVIDLGRLLQHGQSPEGRVQIGNAGGGDLNARAATSMSWLKLRQAADELFVAVDTSAAGQYKGTVTVGSDGGTAIIRVHARVDPALPPNAMARAAEPELAPAIPKDALSGAHQNAALAPSSPASAKGAPLSAATAPAPAIPAGRPVTRPTAAPNPRPVGAGYRADSLPGDDRGPLMHVPQPRSSRTTSYARENRLGRHVPRRLGRIAISAGIALVGLITTLIFVPGTPRNSPGPHVSSTLHSSPPRGTSTVDAAKTTVDVFNGGDKQGLAGQVSAALVEDGYLAGEVAATTPLSATEVLYGAGTAASAGKIASLFGITATPSSTVAAGHVEVMLGANATLPRTAATPRSSSSSSAVP
jgi:hypothetical protein